MSSLSVYIAGGAVVFLCLYLYAGDFERYSMFCVGVFRRVKHEPAEIDGHECRETWCETTPGDGEHRQWFKEIVLLGVPVASYGGGSAYYCGDHADVTIQEGDYEETRSVPDSVIWAIVWVVEKIGTDVEAPEDSEFKSVQSNVTTGVGDAMALAPVLLLVLIAAGVLGAVNRATGGIEVE